MSLPSSNGAGPARFSFLRAMIVLTLGAIALTTCRAASNEANPPRDEATALVAEGRKIFFNETFNGNGRTCGTCHREEANLSLTPAFIATLPPDDPLFVAETNPALARNFENPRLMRQFGLILENLDGFDDLENRFVMRGIPHTLALRASIASPQGPRTGWSGDGAPGDGSLRAFATGAVIQHFTRTLNRVPGTDFRLPTPEELDALEAFQLSLGRQQDITLPLPLKGTVAKRGQEIFLDNNLGKCNICHVNAGANALLAGVDAGNANFDTGVENLPDQPARLTGEKVPADDGFGRPGDRTFNVPPLVEAADSGPFFHNNSIETIEGAVAFYDGDAFNNSPSGRFLASFDPNGVGIKLDATQIVEIAAFLRVLNALENIREGQARLSNGKRDDFRLAAIATDDAIRVLQAGGLHPEAVARLEEARRRIDKAKHAILFQQKFRRAAIEALEQARGALVDKS